MQERLAGLREQILEEGRMSLHSLLLVLKWISNVRSLLTEPNSWWITLSQCFCLVFRMWGTCKQKQLPITKRSGQLSFPRVLTVGWSKRWAWKARSLPNPQVSQSPFTGTALRTTAPVDAHASARITSTRKGHTPIRRVPYVPVSSNSM